MRTQKFTFNPLQTNCYVVSDETSECVVIDCSAFFPEERQAVVDYINANRLKPVRLLLTHSHIDHCFGNDTVRKAFGLLPEVHVAEQWLAEHMQEQCEEILGQRLPISFPPIGRYFHGGDIIRWGAHSFKVIETPGHSPGSVMFLCEEEKLAFSGDTIFTGSIGRTDLTGGSMFQMIQSLRMICQMDDDLRLLPGHGEETTIGRECATNPYLDR